MIRIAVDTGGTFTDCVTYVDGRLQISKVASTPQDPGVALLKAVAEMAGGAAAEIRHGTTVGTNTLLERTGARVAFVTTEGFEDSIAIGRQARPKLYDLFVKKEAPLAPRERCLGVRERVASDGSILRAPDASALAELCEAVRQTTPESIAVSLLFSFANPANERLVVDALRGLDVPVSASHEILPEFREYERGSTVLINSYLAPKMNRYLADLDRVLSAGGSRLYVMQSSGGIVPAALAASEPVRTILSGPAGGVVGAREVARAAGFTRILTFDMGGTSTDVALVDGDAGLNTTTESQVMGMPVAIPMLRIHTVGAGGGSLAGFDRGGALKVGPESAGADPGPICYGRGVEPTVTDAHLLLGRLDAEWFLGGQMRLDETRTRTYLEKAKGTVADAERFAEGILQLAEAHMARALRQISVEAGYDPREFTLVSFGGAGPLHACALARELNIPRVLIPIFPGALSAVGILRSDAVRDYSRTVMLQPEDASLARHFEELEERGSAEMAQQGSEGGIASRLLDLRYAGQGYELTVDGSEQFVAAFHRAHEKHYGYSDVARRVEVVNVRVRMTAATGSAEVEHLEAKQGDVRRALIKQKRMYYEGKWLEGAMYDRSGLGAGDELVGPAVVAEYSATTFLPPGARGRVDEWGNLVIDPVMDL